MQDTSTYTYRPEYEYIVRIVEDGSHVLDLGCGSGELLKRLIEEKKVRGRGIEISQALVAECIGKGLSVYHGDIDEGLADYPNSVFDCVILNQTLQVTHKPRSIIREMLRVGKKAIVGFPNFGHLRVRLDLLFRGRMPRGEALPYEWHDTPNIHLCTISDFRALCEKDRIRIVKEVFINSKNSQVPSFLVYLFPNLLAEAAIFVITRR